MKGKQLSFYTYIMMLRGLGKAGLPNEANVLFKTITERLAAGEMAALIKRGFKDFLRAALMRQKQGGGGDPIAENEVSIDASAVNMIVNILIDDGKD
ncbi:hypothetical protein SLA2020_108270 [Shorea laevis]